MSNYDSANLPTLREVPFQFEGYAVRVSIDASDETWFSAADVCATLGYANARDALSRHVETDDVVKRDTIDSMGRMQQASYLNESGLYALIFGSKLASAKRFKKWVTSEVLPSIRKTGGYGTSQIAIDVRDPSQLAAIAMQLIEVNRELTVRAEHAERTKAQIGSKREATAMATASHAKREVERLEIELDRSKSYATVKRMEMLHRGKKFNWRLLKKASCDLSLPPIDVFDANYDTVKGYHVTVWHHVYKVAFDEVPA